MLKLIRLYADSVLLGLAAAIPFMVALVLLDVAGLRDAVLAGRGLAGQGLVAAGLVVIFAGGVFSSFCFALRVVALELAEDRRIAHRKRHGWGRSPRDRRREGE